MKCGTTAMWRNMNNHPCITMCNNVDDPKKTSTEIRFWTDSSPHYNFKKGIEWYKNLFRGECCGEKDADLIRSKEAMRLISMYIPDVKLILTVRNPVDRAFSEYNMSIGQDISKFKQIMNKRKKGFWDRGEYYDRIEKNVLPFFSSKQIFVSVFERMKADPNKELNRVYDFLGIDHIEMPVEKVKFEKRDGKVDGYRNWGSNYKPIDGDARKQLLSEYEDANNKLFNFLGYSIDEWSE